MISEKNQRIMITLPKKQVEWMKKYAKSNGWTPSTLIKYLLIKRVDELYDMCFTHNNEQELQRLIELAKTKWLDEDKEKYQEIDESQKMRYLGKYSHD